MEIHDELFDTTLQTQDNWSQLFLLCSKCKHIPFLKLKKKEGSIVVDIHCQHCRERYHLPIGEYKSLMKIFSKKSLYCTNKTEHALLPAVIYCVNCSNWLCEGCVKDHSTYQLFNHFRISNEVFVNSKCSQHPENPYELYCEECEQAFCDECSHHKEKNHFAIGKKKLIDIIQALNANDIFKKFETIKNRNKETKDSFIEQIDNHINLLSDLRKQIATAYEMNNYLNERITELFLTAIYNYQIFAKFPTIELLVNIKQMDNLNKNEPNLQDLFLETNCLNLINYYKTSYILKLGHKENCLNGDTYEGEMENEKKEGFGVYTSTDGSQYKGEWKNDLKQGRGGMTWSNGESYDGDWVNNKKEGQGRMIYSNGDMYEGAWINDTREGYGVLKRADGAFYKGNWKNDLRHYEGEMTYFTGDTYKGNWMNDEKDGSGVYQWPDGALYDGKWKNDLRNGEGVMCLSNGEIYKGNWENDKKEGKGVNQWADGSLYEGYWKNSLRHNEGKMTYPNGDIYHGNWVNGKMEGFGLLKKKKGTQFQGHWKDNMLDGKEVNVYLKGSSDVEECSNEKDKGVYSYTKILSTLFTEY